MENKSDFNYTFNNQASQDYKSSSISTVKLFMHKKRTNQNKNSAFTASMKEKRQKNKLNKIGNIRLHFVRKLTKKIKLLKAEKKKYKSLSKSLTHDLNEFVKKQTVKPEGTIIKNNKTLDDARYKKITYSIADKNIDQISTHNNRINNITVQNKNKFLMEIPEFRSSESESLEKVSSNSRSRNFDLNEISISSPIRFMCKSK